MAYFSNGTEGMVLDEQCAECPIPDDAPCPILWVQITYNYEQIKNGKETIVSDVLNCLVDKDGDCKMKPILDAMQSTEYVGGEERDTARLMLDNLPEF